MSQSAKSALGKGLGSLIPGATKPVSYTEKAIPQAKQEVLEIPVSEIGVNPRQPRTHFSPGDLEDLIGSIKEHGVLMPIVVTKEGDRYEIIAGERRFRASKTLGLKTVPAIVRKANEQEKLELALIENVQRADLNPLEEARAYKTLTDEFDLTQDEVAERVGKARSTVTNIIRLLDLPEDIQKALREGKLSRTHARTLLAEKDPGKQKQLFQAVLGGGVTVRETEARAIAKRHRPDKDPNLAALEQELQSFLGTKVVIQDNGRQGKIIIEYYSREDLKKLKERLS